MKICHVNLASGYHGGENQTYQLIKQQIKLDYVITVVANPRSLFYEKVKQLPCKVFATKHFLLQHQHDITSDIDVIHVHEGKAIYWALIQSYVTRTPFVVTRRIDNPVKNRLLLKLAYNKADHIIGISRAVSREIKRRFPHREVSVIPSSPVTYPENKDFINLMKETYRDKFIVIQAGNLLEHKGFHITIKAASLIQSEHPDIVFIFLGDGAHEIKLKNMASNSLNIKFLGKQQNMGDWFNIADLFIHPSIHEGLGSVILEAQVAGLPVVATNVGGIPDIIEDGVSGILIDPDEPQQLADAIINLRNDLKKRTGFIQQAKQKLSTFDITYTSKMYEEIYQSCNSRKRLPK